MSFIHILLIFRDFSHEIITSEEEYLRNKKSTGSGLRSTDNILPIVDCL